MKRVIQKVVAILAVLTCSLAVFSGCGNKTESNEIVTATLAGQSTTGVNDILNAGTQVTTHVPTDEERSKALKEAHNTVEGVDVDLTKLNSVMVYSEVFDMVSNPNSYKGKTIRMDGNYSEFYDDTTDTLYRACIIPDATACCQQGIEFVLKDDTNAEELLMVDTPVTVQGTFDYYTEDKVLYCTLRNAEILE